MLIFKIVFTGDWMQDNGYYNCDNRQCTFYRGSIEGRDVIATFLPLLFRFGHVFRTTIILAKLFYIWLAKLIYIFVCGTFSKDQKPTMQKQPAQAKPRQ
jgi:hypothetical protein